MTVTIDNITLPNPPKEITPAFGFSYISERAMREGLGRRQFDRQEMAKVVTYFAQHEHQPACAYCGGSEVHRWDHLIPIRLDGETILGNMVLACQPCDDSKGAAFFNEWMKGTAAKSPRVRGVADWEERIRRLEVYMREFGYVPTPLEERLNEGQRSELVRIRAELRRLKEEVDTLIGNYRRLRG